MLSHQYVQNVVKIVKGLLAQEGMKLKGKAEHPYPQHYRPEVDVSQELEPYLEAISCAALSAVDWNFAMGMSILLWKCLCCQLTVLCCMKVIWRQCIISLHI